ncbi:MAG: CbtB domain-containing protein [SAR324 cluster bacterium]|jgi:cobalt transporter subunit CbtB|nr:CbtB domain-containing protein [SAR324 cluster bacterium]MDP7175997.1 CbtB domain-containing protein [SAR324 cluster bacterium]MDP7582053.1 CbtB domain-containing protein [SAR324 cluster bacterium]MDP7615635.1 CbtB domain-containing protein [SAR324 cluster bacterium]
MTTKTIAAVATTSLDTSDAGVFLQRMTTAVLMLSAGMVLLFAVGFAQGSGNFMHNAAHDTRHAATFPCH